MRIFEALAAAYRGRKSLARWRRLAKQHKRQNERQVHHIAELESERDEARQRAAVLQAENDVYQSQLDLMAGAYERWQALIERDQAIMEREKIDGVTQTRHEVSQPWQ